MKSVSRPLSGPASIQNHERRLPLEHGKTVRRTCTFLQIYYTFRPDACQETSVAPSVSSLPGAAPSLRKNISLFLKIPLAFSSGLGYNTSRTFLSSSMAEHSAVNRRVVGSSPTWGAKQKRPPVGGLFACFHGSTALRPKVNSRRLLTGTEPSAASGRRSEAESGQNKEKSAQRSVFSYVLHPSGL